MDSWVAIEGSGARTRGHGTGLRRRRLVVFRALLDASPAIRLEEVSMKYEKPAVQRFGSLRDLTRHDEHENPFHRS